ncbi:integral membrane protein [Pediococcus damnosus]|uniref:hypothetical protein n=1 Tax=Pediococcus damnosus TaxID=51663 RepID=UPI00078DEF41|nr:hypothetical protein [Pediococcus damnosus]AMV64791.1 integral membrane protein [Pediococcus damnosus]
MSDLRGLLFGLIVVVAIYLLDRYLPRWVGAIPGVIFLGFMIWLIVAKGSANLVTMLVVLVVGEAVLNGIWLETIEDRKKKLKQELSKMKAKDITYK